MRYRILGATEAYDEQGAPLPVGGRRLRALLAALALRTDRTVPVEALIAEVWAEDEPPTDAPAALQALVGRLRRALGRTAIASDPGGYRLTAAPEDVDLHCFERLVSEGRAALGRHDPAAAADLLGEALTLWRGPALADLPDRSAAARPEALLADATRARVEARLLLGHASDVVPELKELIAAQPYDETLHALLIRALRAAGRGADALAAYENARRTLADALGADPGPELRALHAELLDPEGGSADTVAPGGRPEAPKSPESPESPGNLRSPAEPEHPQGPDRPQRPQRKGNLRPRLTSFVGREPELAAIRSDMRRARLVTLTGPGGSGKTRLAEEAAAGHPQAWLAELAPLDHPEAVPGAVVSALGLRETVLMTSELSALPQGDPTALLIEYCAPRSLLLLLDNCEHVIGAAADLAQTLLTRCPDLTVVATSREPLGVPGEFVRPVEPLPPDPAHRLFTERAMAVRPDFAPEDDTEAVAEICRRLDGLPLAIELAAARLRLLTPRQIADRLDDRFRLLTSGSRTVLPRQQTLRAVVDWSWDLLEESERTVLREVSVFAGGWDLAAAEAVCTGPAADLIGALVDKSLLIAEPTAKGDMRYRMLETIHEYATERAAECPELRAAAARRHTAHFRALVEQAEPLLRSAEQLPWIQRLETELDNLRAALQRTIESREEDEALAIVLGIGWFWWLRNYRGEAMEWVTRLLALAPPLPSESPEGGPQDESRHWSWMSLRLLHIFLEVDYSPSDAMAEESYRAYVAQVREAFARPVPAAARFPGLIWPFTTFFLEGSDAARPAMDSVVANCRRYGGDWEIGVSLMFRTHLAVDAPGNLHGVDEDLVELRELAARTGDRWMRAQVSSAAGEAAMARSLHDEARVEYDEALRLAYEVGAYAETPFLLVRLAEIAYREGDRALAVKILDEAGIEADRYGVVDSRAFMRLLQSLMALDDADVPRARALFEASRDEAARGTPPPQFGAALKGVETRIVAAESGPEQALPLLAEGLRDALDHRCAEVVVAGLVDGGATLVSRLGDHPRAARLLAFGTRLRGGHPRPMPERAEADQTRAAALAAIGPERYEAESAAGTGLTADQALAELTRAAPA
ncbi:BTAD domain-containing putative transcriptional regulator [Streptomyces sp. NPDC051214]|uniref:AfsR/SARP family transcriptional regulator n=1 Tax=Streptomyces sp. NPDC051214 TaxID=3155282 RepID=UPI00342BF48D